RYRPVIECALNIAIADLILQNSIKCCDVLCDCSGDCAAWFSRIYYLKNRIRECKVALLRYGPVQARVYHQVKADLASNGDGQGTARDEVGVSGAHKRRARGCWRVRRGRRAR